MGIDFAPFKIMKISSTDLLTQALNLKKSKMPSYSISALAQALNISPSFVYGIFNGKRILPVSQVGNISKALEMDQVAVERLKKALA
ncbi:MAG: helix-turn-helix domain-containing protein, partial [Pseudobdellovibrionaceae bacterium]